MRPRDCAIAPSLQVLLCESVASARKRVSRISLRTIDGSSPCLLSKRKGHPATGRPFLQGRIVPTEARPSKLSAQIVGSRYQRVKQFLGLKLLYFQQLKTKQPSLRKSPKNS